MATSGNDEINSSTSLENDDEPTRLCFPCLSDGNNLAAVGYCDTCKTFLCEYCFKYHTVPLPMRKRRLLDREQVLKGKPVKDIGQCDKHEDETVLYHCPTHSFLGCHICFFEHQTSCKEARYIPKISKTITSSDEFQEFMTNLDRATETANSLLDKCRRNIVKVGKCHTEAYAAIKAFKVEILEAADQLEKELYQKADTCKAKELSKLNPIVDKCLQVQTDVENIAAKFEVLQKKTQKGDLYISMIEAKCSLVSLQAELSSAKDKNVVKTLKFEANTDLLETFKSPFGLGTLRMMQDIVKCEHLKDIEVKLSDDKNTCYITDFVVINEHKLLASDWTNTNVKIIDTKQQKVLSAMTVSSQPWSLAKVTDNTVVATLPIEKKIVFIRTDPALSTDTEIGVDGACHGVAYNYGKLVVSFHNPHKVEIMDVKGSVMRTIQTDRSGQALFNTPNYVAINPESSLIYVSNAGSHNVVCLRFDGTVMATYKDNELQTPWQAIVDSTGNVYVCGYSSHNVHQMTEDCKKIKVLLTSSDGLSYPRTISYQEPDGRLYVGRNNTDHVKVYQLPFDDL